MKNEESLFSKVTYYYRENKASGVEPSRIMNMLGDVLRVIPAFANTRFIGIHSEEPKPPLMEVNPKYVGKMPCPLVFTIYQEIFRDAAAVAQDAVICESWTLRPELIEVAARQQEEQARAAAAGQPAHNCPFNAERLKDAQRYMSGDLEGGRIVNEYSTAVANLAKDANAKLRELLPAFEGEERRNFQIAAGVEIGAVLVAQAVIFFLSLNGYRLENTDRSRDWVKALAGRASHNLWHMVEEAVSEGQRQ